jgi:Transposase, Mutator family
VAGWPNQDQPTFEAFLAPLRRLEWPILAVLSDKQRGLVPAVATVLPHSQHQFCQAHYLRNLAEPLAEVDSAFKVALRQTVRAHVGTLICQEPQAEPGHGGVLTVTGLLPSPLLPRAPVSCSSEAQEVVTQLLRHTRYL